jgi:hypothetical protein
MATIKPKNVSKYSDLTDEERKKKYIELSKEWYHKKTPEEKKKISQRTIELRQGECEICKNNRVYANLQQHKKTQAHIRKAEKQ